MVVGVGVGVVGDGDGDEGASPSPSPTTSIDSSQVRRGSPRPSGFCRFRSGPYFKPLLAPRLEKPGQRVLGLAPGTSPPSEGGLSLGGLEELEVAGCGGFGARRGLEGLMVGRDLPNPPALERLIDE